MEQEDEEGGVDTGKLLYQQQQKMESAAKARFQNSADDEEEEELDVDISQRLLELQQNKAAGQGSAQPKRQAPLHDDEED